MKTLINKSAFTIAIIGLLSSYIFASVTIISGFKKSEISNSSCSVNVEAINYEKAISIDYNFDEEEYINDIPFNTISVSEERNYNKAISVDFEFEQESYINDIPFDTNETAHSL